MGCEKAMVGTLTLDHTKKKAYRPLIDELYHIADYRNEVKFNGAILTIEIDRTMSCCDAQDLDDLINELDQYAAEGFKVRTTCEGETWYIYGGPAADVARLKTDQALCELCGVIAGLGNRPEVDLVAVRRKLQDLADELGKAGAKFPEEQEGQST